ncbi:LysR substrate-binding domain-containing protein [Paraburkholderia phenazinium]|jgi:DNA-binding transcriptional LysR family regulator|uniref:Transcriptional regulator, LysR family n=1 Tax=Paraburkholderia phenazinium TaxID=60549 RepID=A0A1N6J0P6_9BURK|nr:LysR substrate-binding domain-containing protein [Paraburkholderia phenazinium]SIO37924.1 transcriptional regulator, LysR family [Paraburkholderia phenazinium]
MELRHLRYFVVVGEEQHFGRAAERLRVAQPSLSRQVRDLESELGFPLFDRLPRGVRLSAAGKLFLDDSRRILQDVDEARRRAERIALGRAGTLRIGIATALSWHAMVVDSIRELRRRQPDAELMLHHMLSIHQIEAVLSGRLDAGFSAAITPWHKDLAHWEFAQDRILLAVPKGHPLTKRQGIRLRDLQDMPFIWFQRWANPGFDDQLMRACARGGLRAPHIVQEAMDRDTLLGLVQCQIGIAWSTESTRWHCPRSVVLLPVVDMNVRLPFNLIWKKDNSSPLLQKFVAQVQAEGNSVQSHRPE